LALPILPLLSALLPVSASLVVIPGVIAVLALVGSISSIPRIIPSIGGAIWIDITSGDGAEDAEAQEGEEYVFHCVYSFVCTPSECPCIHTEQGAKTMPCPQRVLLSANARHNGQHVMFLEHCRVLLTHYAGMIRLALQRRL
jgi:hypothetical protein